MIGEPEFVRGNQKSYIRIICEKNVLDGYEYRMCKNNTLGSILGFQLRSQNGTYYFYYEVSGMQSLDVFLQSQKLKRDFMLILAKKIVRLCKELSEYALDLSSVVLEPKYVMITNGGEEVRFLYSFSENGIKNEGLEKLLESCIEYLDYKDEELVTLLYKVYENMLEQGECFGLEKEMESILLYFSEEEKELSQESINLTRLTNPFEDYSNEIEVPLWNKSKVAQNETKHLRVGLVLLLLLNVAILCIWRPLTILKIFFCVSVGVVLIVLNLNIIKQKKISKKEEVKQMQAEECIEEYERSSQGFGINNESTQMITVKDTEKFLCNVQGDNPQYIYFSEAKKIIGKNKERAQICITSESVSRIHAMILRRGDEYIVEDLNSTNGTWINGKALIPRNPCVLKEGDKVRFAEVEYIFR